MSCECSKAFRAAVVAQTVAWLEALARMPQDEGKRGFRVVPVWPPLPAFSPSCRPRCAEGEELLETHFRREEPKCPRPAHSVQPRTEERQL